jgi:hypothetical protein
MLARSHFTSLDTRKLCKATGVLLQQGLDMDLVDYRDGTPLTLRSPAYWLIAPCQSLHSL